MNLQLKLQTLGFYSGKIDGIEGPQTKAAIVAFKESVGLRARPYVGPITRRLLLQTQVLPWLTEINKVWGLHEVRDNKRLSHWLRSDGETVGDPARIAWCGDAVDTAVTFALPEEPRVHNPYWARNWAKWGVPSPLVYGAILAFERGSGGHVGFLVGVNASKTLLRVRGGNQQNAINDTWIKASRLLPRGSRWPSTWSASDQAPAPILNSSGARISRNEA